MERDDMFEIMLVASGEATAAESEATKKVFIKTYGCQMNVYDSQRMNDALTADGYVVTETIEDADLVLLNTCHIRERATEKVYSQLGRLGKLKAKRADNGRELIVGVTGCVAQAEGHEILRRATAVDLVIGPQTYHRLSEVVNQARGGQKVVDTEYALEDKFEHLPRPRKAEVAKRGVTSFLTVQEGCNKFCTFCVVPYTRGSEVSRSVAQIVTEAERLAEAGIREITLLGQNVNAWHGKGSDGSQWGLGRLLYHLAEIPGLARLRYTTSHPRDVDDELIAAHRNLEVLMPYLHLPVQSGSDRILKAMNRKHTAADYLRLIERIRTARPDIAISGDFILGFPGETDEDFEATMKIVHQTNYASAYTFKYSLRPGTPGAAMGGHVEEKIKDERQQRLQALLTRQQHTFADGMVGTTMSTLLEKSGREPGQIIGRSPWLQPVIVDEKAGEIGDVINVRITKTGTNSLFAEAV